MLLLLAAAITMPTCNGAADCEVKWGRAIRWVIAHNPTIEAQNDSSITTAEPLGKTNKYQVTRIPDGDGRYTLDLRLGCSPLRSCKRDDLKRDFAATVMAD